MFITDNSSHILIKLLLHCQVKKILFRCYYVIFDLIYRENRVCININQIYSQKIQIKIQYNRELHYCLIFYHILLKMLVYSILLLMPSILIPM